MKTKSKVVTPIQWNNTICEMGTAVVNLSNEACKEDGTIPLTERQQFFVMQEACTCIRAAMLALLEQGGKDHYEAIKEAGVKK